MFNCRIVAESKMEGFELIKQGAEAKIYRGKYLGKSALVKERFVKKYRQPELDTKITIERIKAEARTISRLKSKGVDTPALYLADLDRRIIIMEYIEDSKTAKQFFDNISDEKEVASVCIKIGTMIGRMHQNNIVHGDLTTSNILILNKDQRVVFIDFGLSYTVVSSEDKGVDLYVLERALLSTHSNASELLPLILEAYEKENQSESDHVMKKYEEVRARGRKRTMVG